jgi:hypothetical protein
MLSLIKQAVKPFAAHKMDGRQLYTERGIVIYFKNT